MTRKPNPTWRRGARRIGAVATGMTLAFLTLLGPTNTGQAETLPADCSKAAIPSTPVKAAIAGKSFEPKSIKLRRSGGMTSGDAQYDSYELSFRSADDIFAPLEASITVIVRKGQAIDGRVFRRLPTKETGTQPTAAPGLPENQGWSVKQREPAVGVSHVTHVGSLRLEFGKRQGKTIAGKVYLCVPAGQTTLFDKTPTASPSYAVGAFTAQLE